MIRSWLARRIYGYLKEENAATAVEFAIVSTIFLTLVFGIFETALILFTWNSLQDSLEKATRYALVHPDATSDELRQIVANSMSGLSVDASDILLDVAQTTTTSNDMQFLEMTGTYHFSNNMPFMPASFSTMDLTASSRLPIQCVGQSCNASASPNPTPAPTAGPTPSPSSTGSPSPSATGSPSPSPTGSPSPSPTPSPTPAPTPSPTTCNNGGNNCQPTPTPAPTPSPTPVPAPTPSPGNSGGSSGLCHGKSSHC